MEEHSHTGRTAAELLWLEPPHCRQQLHVSSDVPTPRHLPLKYRHRQPLLASCCSIAARSCAKAPARSIPAKGIQRVCQPKCDYVADVLQTSAEGHSLERVLLPSSPLIYTVEAERPFSQAMVMLREPLPEPPADMPPPPLPPLLESPPPPPPKPGRRSQQGRRRCCSTGPVTKCNL
jgi:hypothetical protein